MKKHGHSADREQYAMEKMMYINKCIGCINFFGVHENKLAYSQYTMHTICHALVHE